MFGKDTIVISLKLFIITALAALCLAFVNKVTTPIIEVNTTKAEEEALQKVLADAYDFKTVDAPKSSLEGVSIEKLNVGYAGDKVLGYVVTVVSSEGYGGDVKVMVGIDKELKVTKIEILEHSETAGLGANAKKPEFAGQFEGKNSNSGSLSVVKGETKKENEISAISSATITSKAVTKAVNAAIVAAEYCDAEGVADTVEDTVEKAEEIETETSKQLEAAERGDL